VGSPLVRLPLYEGRSEIRVNPADVMALEDGRGKATLRLRDGSRHLLDVSAYEAERRLWPEVPRG
jgi:DNA-binding LytR/AlgR family response regulator